MMWKAGAVRVRPRRGEFWSDGHSMSRTVGSRMRTIPSCVPSMADTPCSFPFSGRRSNSQRETNLWRRKANCSIRCNVSACCGISGLSRLPSHSHRHSFFLSSALRGDVQSLRVRIERIWSQLWLVSMENFQVVLDCMYMNSSQMGCRTFISTLVLQSTRLVLGTSVSPSTLCCSSVVEV